MNPAKEREAAEEKGTVLLYALDGCIGRKREEEGAKLRIPPRSATLEPGRPTATAGRCFLRRIMRTAGNSW